MPALSYWMIVLEPPAPVESAPLPYSTNVEPFAVVTEFGLGRTIERSLEGLDRADLRETAAAFLSGTKTTP